MKSLRLTFILLLISPYFLWWKSFTLGGGVEGLTQVFLKSAAQASISALGAMTLGAVFFTGLAAFQSRRGRVLAEMALLSPNVLPPIFLILSLFVWIFPIGFAAVIGAHVFINAGLVAIALDRLSFVKLSGLAETAWVLGASRKAFLLKVVWREERSDLAAIFLFIFSLCFTSFSIPLLLGGSHELTPEIAIYDAIRVEGNWSRAVWLALAQTAMLLIFARLIPSAASVAHKTRHAIPLLSVKAMRFAVFLPALIWAAALLRSFSWAENCLDAAALSLALGMAAGLWQTVLFLITAFLLPSVRLDRFLTGYLAPSPSIIGFGLLLVPFEASFVKLSLALALLAFPLLYRGLVRAELGALTEQMRVARYLGASHLKIAADIVWPQILPAILRASALAAVWAAGDFAISGILASSRLKTLPLMMTDSIAQYQWAAAQALLWPLIAVTILLYGFFTGAARYVAS